MKNNTLLNQCQHVIKSISFAKQYDKHHESDCQMLQRVGRNFGILFFVILMFDTLLDWLLGLIDLIFQIIYLIIETIEYALLLFLEHLFNFNQHQGETVIVNGTIIFTLYLAYRFMLVAPDLTVRAKQYLLSRWSQFIKQEYSCWQSMSLSYKLKWLGAYSFGASCLLFFL